MAYAQRKIAAVAGETSARLHEDGAEGDRQRAEHGGEDGSVGKGGGGSAHRAEAYRAPTPCAAGCPGATLARDARASDRHGHVPVQRHRGLDAPAPDAGRRVARAARAAPGDPACRVRRERRGRGQHRGRLVLRGLRVGAGGGGRGARPPARARDRGVAATAWSSGCGSGSTPATGPWRTARTSASTSIAPAASRASATAGRSS